MHCVGVGLGQVQLTVRQGGNIRLGQAGSLMAAAGEWGQYAGNAKLQKKKWKVQTETCSLLQQQEPALQLHHCRCPPPPPPHHCHLQQRARARGREGTNGRREWQAPREFAL